MCPETLTVSQALTNDFILPLLIPATFVLPAPVSSIAFLS